MYWHTIFKWCVLEYKLFNLIIGGHFTNVYHSITHYIGLDATVETPRTFVSVNWLIDGCSSWNFTTRSSFSSQCLHPDLRHITWISETDTDRTCDERSQYLLHEGRIYPRCEGSTDVVTNVFIHSKTYGTVYELTMQTRSETFEEVGGTFFWCYLEYCLQHSSVFELLPLHCFLLQLQSDLSLINRDSDHLSNTCT